MKMLIYPPLDERRLTLVREAAGEMVVVNAKDDSEAKTAIVSADAFYGKITPELLKCAKQLQWVQSPTASLEHYLFPELIAHPCQLSNMRGLFYDVIADHTLGFVLCFARNLHLYVRQQVRAKWHLIGADDQAATIADSPGLPSAVDFAHLHLPDCTLGVVGVGSIGIEICKRAAAFGMRVIGVDPHTTEVPDVIRDVWKPERLPELLATSDFVVIAAPHTPETYKLIQRTQLQQMKSTAYLINIGRGVIIDLADLTMALQQAEIAGAALDVYEIEPLPADHPLWKMENVILTPHIAAASPKVSERHTETLLNNIRRFAHGELPLTLVDKQRWY